MEKLVKNLNCLLADLNVFYRKLQNYHWNVKGKDFFTMHEKLEEYYDEINEQIDEVAEHILMLNSESLGTMKDYMENTSIVEAENKKIKSDAIFHNIVNDLGMLLKNIKEKGLEVTKISELIYKDNYTIDVNGTQKNN